MIRYGYLNGGGYWNLSIQRENNRNQIPSGKTVFSINYLIIIAYLSLIYLGHHRLKASTGQWKDSEPIGSLLLKTLQETSPLWPTQIEQKIILFFIPLRLWASSFSDFQVLVLFSKPFFRAGACEKMGVLFLLFLLNWLFVLLQLLRHYAKFILVEVRLESIRKRTPFYNWEQGLYLYWHKYDSDSIIILLKLDKIMLFPNHYYCWHQYN